MDKFIVVTPSIQEIEIPVTMEQLGNLGKGDTLEFTIPDDVAKKVIFDADTTSFVLMGKNDDDYDKSFVKCYPTYLNGAGEYGEESFFDIVMVFYFYDMKLALNINGNKAILTYEGDIRID